MDRSLFAPVTLAFVLLGFAGAALVGFDYYSLRFARLFLFYDSAQAFTPSANAWHNLLQGEYWRLFTPMFLHFGAIHIIFNALWFWFLGSRIENAYGSWALLALVLAMGVTSNVAQALVSFPIPFGGLSGVVYGLLAFVWLHWRVRRIPSFYLPPALFPLMVAFLLIGWTGALDLLIDGSVANTAHTAGFVSGLALAIMALRLPVRRL